MTKVIQSTITDLETFRTMVIAVTDRAGGYTTRPNIDQLLTAFEQLYPTVVLRWTIKHFKETGQMELLLAILENPIISQEQLELDEMKDELDALIAEFDQLHEDDNHANDDYLNDEDMFDD